MHNVKCTHILRRIILLAILFSLLLVGCSSNQVGKQEINWTLHGAFIFDGAPYGQTFEISVQGQLPANMDPSNTEEVEMRITWPESFRYNASNPQTFTMQHMQAETESQNAIYRCSGTAHDPALNIPVVMQFFFCPEEGFMVFRWADQSGETYVAASTDPNADLVAVFSEIQQALDFSSSSPASTNSAPSTPHSATANTSVTTVPPSEGAFEISMYGAEIDAEGNVIQRMNFELKGQINKDGYPGHDSLTLEPITLGDLTLRLDYSPMLYHELSESSYYLNWLSYLGNLNRHTTIEMGLSRDMTSCMLIVEDSQTRYFVGSIDEDFDPAEILALYRDLLI